MIARTRRIIVFAAVALFGGAMLVYGLTLNGKDVAAKSEDVTTVARKSEPELIKDASVGALERDEQGQLKQSYGIGEAPPEACPT